MPNPPDPITSAEAAQLIGKDRSTITRWVKAGRLTPTKKMLGPRGAYLFDPADIERLAKSDAA